MPNEIKVSMDAAPCRRLVQAARWKGSAPHTTTGAARVSESHCQASNCSAGTIAIAMTGTVSRATTSRRWRASATGSAPGADGPPSTSATGGAGRAAR